MLGKNAWHQKRIHSSSLKFIPSIWDTLYKVGFMCAFICHKIYHHNFTEEFTTFCMLCRNWKANTQRAIKFKKVQAKKLVKSDKSKKLYVKLHFWQFSTFSHFKNWFLAIFETVQEMDFGQKMFSWNWFIWFHEFFCLDFFVAHCAAVKNA